MKNFVQAVVWKGREFWVNKKPQFMWDFFYWLDNKIK